MIMPSVAASVRFGFLSDHLESVGAGYVFRRWIDIQKADPVLSSRWHDACTDQDLADACEDNRAVWSDLYNDLMDYAGTLLPADLMDAVRGHLRDQIAYIEVAQAIYENDQDHAMIWDLWEQQDRHDAEQARIDMYYNEY